jgi:hypothetical protein
MTPSCQLKVKMKEKNIFEPEMNLRKVTMECDRLIVFIRHDSAEIWGFRYRLTLVIGTLKFMASTGVFVRLVRALKHFISSFSTTRSTLLT